MPSTAALALILKCKCGTEFKAFCPECGTQQGVASQPSTGALETKQVNRELLEALETSPMPFPTDDLRSFLVRYAEWTRQKYAVLAKATRSKDA